MIAVVVILSASLFPQQTLVIAVVVVSVVVVYSAPLFPQHTLVIAVVVVVVVAPAAYSDDCCWCCCYCLCYLICPFARAAYSGNCGWMRSADSSGSGDLSLEQRNAAPDTGSSSSLYSKTDANIPLKTLRGQ